MKINIKHLLLLSILFVGASCEKVIDIDLDEAATRIVVDGYIENTDSNSTLARVKISRSAPYYNGNDFDKINQATLFVRDKNGIDYPFVPEGEGVFSCNTLPQGNSYDQYYFHGNIEGKDIEGYTTIPQRVIIDSIYTKEGEFGAPGEKDINPAFEIQDIAGIDNYYRFRVSVDGVPEPDIFLGSDNGRDGEVLTYTLRRIDVLPGQIVQIDFLCIDEEAYEYYSVARDNIGSSGFGAAPGNPTSNIKGDVLGIFCGQTIDRKTIIVL